MKKMLLSVVAILCLAGFSSISFADDMGKGKDSMKGEMKGDKRKTHDDMGDMKQEKNKMQGEMKGGSDKMKGEKDDMDKHDMGTMKGGK